MVDVSIIIVCMNRPDNLYPCLESIRRTTRRVTYEVLVVAYMYGPDGLAKAREDFPWVTFIESNEIRGFSENNNIALKQARGRFCFILNDDTELPGPTVDLLVEDFEELPEGTAIVSPTLLNADGSLQLCGRPPYPARHYVLQQWHLFSEPKDNTAGQKPAAVIGGRKLFRTWNITGAAFLIPTELFRDLGWFDERFFFTPEDIALGTLACRKGLRLYVDTSAQVVHKWRTTASRIMGATRPAAVRGSLMHFSGFRNWKYLLLAVPVWCAEFAKRTKAAVVQALRPNPQHRTELQTYRNITRSIFTHRTPKEIFTRYFNEIKQRGGSKG
ncbi:MAG: glycosyltransferase [Bacteroidales bacterium]|nr:glycosyltransferase [Bacteroidales bacterium]